MITEEQKRRRQQFLGGSDAPVVMGISPYKTRRELYHEKRGELTISPDVTEAMEIGAIIESAIAELYTYRTGRALRQHDTLIHPQYAWMGVNVDRLIDDPRKGVGVLEIKNYSTPHGAQIYSLADVPDEVYVQLQHGIAVAMSTVGATWGAVAILIGGTRLFCSDIERDDELIRGLIELEASFWECVQSGHPPDDNVSTDVLARLYPKDSGRTVVLDTPEALRIAQELEEWKAAAKQAEEEIEKRKAWFQLAMQDASVATIPGWGSVTWKHGRSTTKTIVDEERLQQYPEAYAACCRVVQTTGARVFRMRPGKEAS
jgi:putative phage-type endonuclease